MKKTLPGINIQYPISRLIVEGTKTIETRTYPIPLKYVGIDLVLIETPGRTGNFKARIIGIIKFEESFQYSNSKLFYADQKKHFVAPDSIWAWKPDKPKWGWPVEVIKSFEKPIPLRGKKGIRYAQSVTVDL